MMKDRESRDYVTRVATELLHHHRLIYFITLLPIGGGSNIKDTVEASGQKNHKNRKSFLRLLNPLTRALRRKNHLLWIVVEDSPSPSLELQSYLNATMVPHVHLSIQYSSLFFAEMWRKLQQQQQQDAENQNVQNVKGKNVENGENVEIEKVIRQVAQRNAALNYLERVLRHVGACTNETTTTRTRSNTVEKENEQKFDSVHDSDNEHNEYHGTIYFSDGKELRDDDNDNDDSEKSDRRFSLLLDRLRMVKHSSSSFTTTTTTSVGVDGVGGSGDNLATTKFAFSTQDLCRYGSDMRFRFNWRDVNTLDSTLLHHISNNAFSDEWR